MTTKKAPTTKTPRKGRARNVAAAMPSAATDSAAVMDAPVETQSAPVIDFAAYVFSPYRGEATHEDKSRLLVPISSLTLDETNARLHDETNIRQIRASLRRRGQQTPIKIDREGRVLKGNGTTYAAYLEGWAYIWVSVSELEGDEAMGYAIADNASGLSSKWDFSQLATNIQLIKERTDGTELAFTEDDFALEASELQPILAADWSPGQFTGEHNEDPPSEGGAQQEQAQGQQAEGGSTLPRGEHAQTNPSDLDEDDRADKCPPIPVTRNMRVVIDVAIERVRLMSGDLSISDGKCLELICAEYLAGAPTREQAMDVYEGKLTDSLEPVGQVVEQHDIQLREDESEE